MEAFVSAGVAILVYINTLGSDFVYDDSRAIVKNYDIRPTTSITNLLYHDFWGTPMTHSGSHMSYRPVTTFSFRINYRLSGLDPWSYHLFNVMLHSLSTWLFVAFIKQRVFHNLKSSKELSLYAGVYFAVHPIHTEAVAGVVGRADILSAIFVFAALLCYNSHCDHLESHLTPQNESLVVDTVSRMNTEDTTHCRKTSRRKMNKKKNIKTSNRLTRTCYGQNPMHNCPETTSGSNIIHTKVLQPEVPKLHTGHFAMEGLTILCAVLAIFSKETGFSALPLCIAYDLWMRSDLGVFSVCKVMFTEVKSPFYRCLRRRIWRLVISTMTVISLRILPWMLLSSSSTTPFSATDNPASVNESFLTRTLTFNHLIFHNIKSMIFPVTLSYDWGGMPMVESITDSRAVCTAFLYATIAVGLCQLWSILRRRDGDFNAKYLSSAQKGVEENRRRSREETPNKTERPSSSRVVSEGTNIQKKAICTTAKIKSQSLHNSVVDEGVSLDSLEYICPEHDKFATDISLSRLMFDHVKSSTKVHVERAESTQSSGYATESSEEGRQDDVPQSQSSYDDQSTIFSARAPPEKTSNVVNVVVLGLGLVVIPFLPATNLLFYVGFIVAERVLYLPSAGFCILIVCGWQKGVEFLRMQQCSRLIHRRISKVSYLIKLFILVSLAIRTMHRNSDWKSEYHLYRSGISTSPAKSWSNLGNVMKESGRIKVAESCYLKALSVRGNMADVHYNLGLLYQEQKRHIEALERYHMAIQYRNTLAVAYLNSGIVLSALGRSDEAEKMYQLTVRLDDTGLRDPTSHAKAKISALYNLGCLLSSQDRHEEAIVAFEEAVKRLTPDFQPHSLYNMLGQSLYKVGRTWEAETRFKSALRAKPDHIPAHLTYALLLRDRGNIAEAKQLYDDAIRLNPSDHTSYNHFAKLLINEENLIDAADMITQAYQTKSGKSDYETVMLAGDIFRLLKSYIKAERFYRIATALKPGAETALINLGAALHLQDKYSEAKSCYQSAQTLNPNSEIAKINLRKLANLMQQ